LSTTDPGPSTNFGDKKTAVFMRFSLLHEQENLEGLKPPVEFRSKATKFANDVPFSPVDVKAPDEIID